MSLRARSYGHTGLEVINLLVSGLFCFKQKELQVLKEGDTGERCKRLIIQRKSRFARSDVTPA
jgi:hypothetical protein